MAARAAGVTLGSVSDVADPKGLGRIRVKFALTGQLVETDWVQILSMFAGTDCGAFFLPQPGDSALLAFANGDSGKPYVMGFLWNGVQKPPVTAPQQQQVRMIKTKLGKTILIDDSEQGRITIVDEKDNRIDIDSAHNTISIASQGDLTISAKGKLTISADQVLVQNTAGSVKVELTAAGMTVDGADNLALKATMIDLN
ncbi:phage baseplate assembly protein V [Undibacterium sp. Di26W]|uniref:phage baseplate assembly protein V n=1 Tax=Undibacterium sp. Di26W TaxID=3413035 RepID=UPI003BF3715D